MYAGAELAPLGGRCRPVTVPGAVAARIYLLNARRWLADHDFPALNDNLREMEAGLSRVVEDDGGTTVSWVVRQVAVRT